MADRLRLSQWLLLLALWVGVTTGVGQAEAPLRKLAARELVVLQPLQERQAKSYSALLRGSSVRLAWLEMDAVAFTLHQDRLYQQQFLHSHTTTLTFLSWQQRQCLPPLVFASEAFALSTSIFS